MRLNVAAWSAHRVLHLLLALALVRGLIYVSVVPPWQHHDEPGHVEYVEYMARHHRPPTRETMDIALRHEIVASMQQHRFATYQPTWSPPKDETQLLAWDAIPLPQFRHPPLYYLLGAGLLSVLPSGAIEAHLYALRLMSVVLNILLLLIAVSTVSCLLPGRKEILYGVLLFIIFLPAYSDISTAANNDVLANLLFTGLTYLLIRQVIRGPSWPLGLAIVCVFSLGLVTKRTTVVGLLPLLAGMLISIEQRGRKYLWIAMIILALLGLMGGGAVLDWGANQGLMLSPRVDEYLFHGRFSSFVDSLLNWERSWPAYHKVVPLLFRGFWGNFTWGAEAFSAPLYYFLLIVTLAALIGVIGSLVRRSNPLCLDHRQKQALWLLIFTLATAWLAAVLRVHPIRETGWNYLPRARYTYVAIVPAAILFVTGLRAWMPSRWRSWLVVGLAVGGVLIDTLFLAKYLLPFYLG
jgi:hypothetical protein